MALPDYTTQDAATYKANIDSTAADHDSSIKVGTLNTKVIDIGDWNMDSTVFVNVAHGLPDYTKIRSISALIRRDDDSTYYDFATADNNTAGTNSGLNASTTNINLSRATGGTFDGINFNATTFNRGWIVIQYTD